MQVELARYLGHHRHDASDLHDAIRQTSGGGGFVWIVLDEPDQAELDDVADAFGLHHLAVEDAFKARQRPKVERYGDSLFLVLRTAEYVDADESVEFGEVLVFADARYIVVVRHGRRLDLTPVHTLLEQRDDLAAQGTTAAVYAVLDAVVDRYEEVVEGLDDDINQVELEVFAADRERGASAERIYFLKREVLQFHRVLTPMTTAVASLRRDPMFADGSPMADYLRDVYDHLLRAADRLQTVRELLIAALTANATELSLRQNEDMRRISAWVAIVAVPTLIAGVYGMNFDHLPELHWRYGYFFALGLMAGVMAALHRIFRRSGWL